MEKLKMHTPDFTDENIAKIAALFPNCVTETTDDNGNLKKVVDFDLLKQELSGEIVEGNRERYHLDWVGKREALLTANAPIAKTLRPVREESVDFDTTKNLYIEGDNLDALKLLQETYLGKIKMIYIDPPYNTGNDFIYEDDFAEDKDAYFERSMQKDENGNRLVANAESNGRFHSDWLSMMYPRLKLARNLLRDDGVIFISADENEQANLKRICDEVFGADNFLECIIWKKRATPPNDRNIGRIHEYIISYTKNFDQVLLGLLERDEKSIARYSNPDNDERGEWVASDLSANGKGGRLVASCVYPIVNPKTNEEFLPSEGRCWLFNKEKMNRWISEGRISFRENTGAPFLKRYLSEVRQGLTLPTILTEMGFSSTSATEIDNIFNKKGIFEYAKPTTLIKPLLRIGAPNKDSIILDFFSGSATTAHAVMQLNAEDGGNRQFIMVQLPEETDEKSEAFKAGYKTIAEIGKERIRRAGKKISDERQVTSDKKQLSLLEDNSSLVTSHSPLDIGFRVLKIDSSNMKDVYYTPDKVNQEDLFDQITNIKEDRTDEDLLFQILLDWGVDLTLPIISEKIDGKKVWCVDENAVAACFETEINEDFVKELAKRKPMRMVFKDESFADDNAKINAEQIFKLMSPSTEVKTI